MEKSGKEPSESKEDQPDKGDTTTKKDSESEIFSCTICPYTTKYKQFLNLHYKVNHKDVPFPSENLEQPEVKIKDKYFHCNQCNFRCPRRSTLRDHMMDHNKKDVPENNNTGEQEEQKVIDLTHSDMDIDDINTESPSTSTQIPSKGYQTKESASQQTQTVFNCNSCDYVTIDKNLITEHVSLHTKEIYFYICNICDFFTPDINQHDQHMKQHEQDGLKCEVCGDVFQKIVHLTNHRKIHEQKEAFVCHLCKRVFTHKHYLQMHMKVHFRIKPATAATPQTVEESGFACATCGEMFLIKAELNKHWKSHFDQNILLCGVCGKKFFSGDALKSHLETHIIPQASERTYECPFCQVNFTDYYELEKHIELHPDE